MTDSIASTTNASTLRRRARRGWLLGIPAAIAFAVTLVLAVAIRLHASPSTIFRQYESQATSATLEGRFDVAQLCHDRVNQIREAQR